MAPRASEAKNCHHQAATRTLPTGDAAATPPATLHERSTLAADSPGGKRLDVLAQGSLAPELLDQLRASIGCLGRVSLCRAHGPQQTEYLRRDDETGQASQLMLAKRVTR